jgi:hypothetical protein
MIGTTHNLPQHFAEAREFTYSLWPNPGEYTVIFVGQKTPAAEADLEAASAEFQTLFPEDEFPTLGEHSDGMTNIEGQDPKLCEKITTLRTPPPEAINDFQEFLVRNFDSPAADIMIRAQSLIDRVTGYDGPQSIWWASATNEEQKITLPEIHRAQFGRFLSVHYLSHQFANIQDMGMRIYFVPSQAAFKQAHEAHIPLKILQLNEVPIIGEYNAFCNALESLHRDIKSAINAENLPPILKQVKDILGDFDDFDHLAYDPTLSTDALKSISLNVLPHLNEQRDEQTPTPDYHEAAHQLSLALDDVYEKLCSLSAKSIAYACTDDYTSYIQDVIATAQLVVSFSQNTPQLAQLLLTHSVQSSDPGQMALDLF